MKLPLSPRLLACAKFVSQGDRIADIGCDHGYLSIHLLQKGTKCHCKAPLATPTDLACRTRSLFIFQTGQKNIPHDFDTMICAGMGADTMVSILDASPWLKSSQYRLILQCQSKTHLLRRYLSESGWQIARETVLKDGRFLYTVMEVLWLPEKSKLTVGQWYFPPALAKSADPELPAYYHRLLFSLRRAVLGRGENADPYMQEALTELENDPSLFWLKEAEQ